MTNMQLSASSLKSAITPDIVYNYDDKIENNKKKTSDYPSKLDCCTSHAVMSAELSSNFDELTRLAEKKRALDTTTGIVTDNSSSSTVSSENEEMVQLTAHQKRLAEETAILANEEVQRMQNAIAELESLLESGNADDLNIIVQSPDTIHSQENEPNENELDG
jgi:hypothetical protein